jgi:hypothetical protein
LGHVQALRASPLDPVVFAIDRKDLPPISTTINGASTISDLEVTGNGATTENRNFHLSVRHVASA